MTTLLGVLIFTSFVVRLCCLTKVKRVCIYTYHTKKERNCIAWWIKVKLLLAMVSIVINVGKLSTLCHAAMVRVTAISRLGKQHGHGK